MEQIKRLTVSGAPHIFSKNTTTVLMLDVIVALVPVIAAGIWLFGWNAARVCGWDLEAISREIRAASET